jgi:hypothetical protein
MKEKFMKLSVLVGVPALALFIMASVASAHLPFPYIQGVYAVTGFDTCGSLPGIMEGIYTFRYDGTGSMSGLIRRPAGDGIPFTVMSLGAAFNYTVKKEGRIEFEYPSGLKVVPLNEADMDPIEDFAMTLNAGPSHGVISPDHSMITISCGPPVYNYVLDGNGDPIEDSKMTCIVSLTGMRIR